MENIKILCIDDEKEIIFALNAIFDFKGWESINAYNVIDGVELFKEYKPNIVLIDYHLPQVNGIEGVKRIRAINNDVPIIVFTIDERQEIAEEFLMAGASDFALKPIKAPDIIARINVHLKLSESMKKQSTKSQAATGDYLTKGIAINTLELIEEHMRKVNDFTTVDEIAEGTGLAYQTTHRYVQYLLSTNKIQTTNEYGKVGRPKQYYKIL